MKTRTSIISGLLLITLCCWVNNASAQGFRALWTKLDSIEKRLNGLKAVSKDDLIKLENKLSKEPPAGSSKLYALRADILSLSKQMNMLGNKVVGYESRLTDSNNRLENLSNLVYDYENSKTSGQALTGDPDVFADMIRELRSLAGGLRETFEQMEKEQITAAPDDGDSPLSVGFDFMNRYLWRGTDFGASPSLQPAITYRSGGLEIGFWGAFTISNTYSDADENDIWASYTVDLKNSMSVSAIITDYYFPNSGVKFFNFNNYNDPDGPGAHIVEVGFSFSGPGSFPVSLSGFVNVFNDAGKNTYVEISYSACIKDTDLKFFAGAAGGSKENPDYYRTENFNFINLGVTTSKEIKFTNYYSLPVSFSYIVNPRIEKSYLVVGVNF